MPELSPRLGPAFLLAAGELGMASAAHLFVREVAASGGDKLVRAALDELGQDFPVLGCIAARWLAGARGPAPTAEGVLVALHGLTRLLVVGLETTWLDVLLPACRGVEVGILTDDLGPTTDLRRVLANYEGLAVGVRLGELHRWSGRRSGLLCFVYGSDGHVVHVPGAWLRVSGPDVRTQFAALVGWNILGGAMELYPRWLAETQAPDFSTVVHP
ncbi:hypothetical protein [Nannocystis pusilla]|uniref:Uncharacterized protein n=1 Tax=Nannocystis pusilla TaxID=889268 RepID=A0ABS7U5Q4_9BACT|nr:hypothetical protein [Nannocystis pusilla]MBZ5715721.1 hypothetical protein [Nannocystis pusilla]